MITTGYGGAALSQAFADALLEPMVRFDLRLYRDGADTGWGIKRASIDLGAGRFDPSSDIELGAVFSTQLDAELYGVDENPTGETVDVLVGVLAAGSYEYVRVSRVTVSKASTARGVTSVRASGPVSLTNVPVGVSGDLSPAEVRAAILSASGVEVGVDAFPVSQTAVHVPDGATCRDALRALALRLGGFAWEDGGAIRVTPYSSAVTYALPEAYIIADPDMPDSDFEATGLSVTASDAVYTYGDGRIQLSDPTATASTSAAQWANVGALEYSPGEVRVAIADPRVTPADVASVGERALPTLGISITYDGGYHGTFSAPGLTGDEAGALVKGVLARTAEEARAIAEAAQATALDGAFLVITSTAGQLFKNGAESTVLQVVVFPNGGDRLETIAEVRARFGPAAYIEWRWMHESSGEWGVLVSSDPHISQGGMWLTVTPDDVATKTTFSASLVVPGEEG